MADHGANGKLVTADLPERNASLLDLPGFVVAGTAPCPAPIPKRWNPDTSTWDVIPGP